jgi:hypothetical protein
VQLCIYLFFFSADFFSDVEFYVHSIVF